MRLEIGELHKRLETTMIYVTHDQVEAMTMADKIVVLQAGVIEQVGSPLDLYRAPRNKFVAGFIGSPKMNVMPCSTEGGTFTLDGHGSGAYRGDRAATQLGVRPEHLSIVDAGSGHCDGILEVSEYLGSDTFSYVSCENLGTLTVRSDGSEGDLRGLRVGLRFEESQCHFFDEDGLSVR